MMKSRKLLAIVLSAAMVMTAMAMPVASAAATKKTKRTLLKQTTWSTYVKKNINTLVSTYGKGTKNHKKKVYKTAYAVFDFDNTSSIFDVEEQLAIYQLDHMAFAFKPEQLDEILATGIENSLTEQAGTDYSENNATFQDWIDDIVECYTALYEKYGPFDADGLDSTKLAAIKNDENFIDFKAKMRAMYDLVGDNFSAATSYPWILYWFTGMTPQQKYNLAYKSHKYYSKVKTSIDTLKSVKSDTKTGIVTVEHNTGIQVSSNIKELYKTLSKNGIKVWVCSASDIDVVRAAVDAFGLHNYVTGVLAMTNKVGSDGKYVNEYDYDTGHAAFALDNKKWKEGKVATKAQTQGAGKVTAINNVLVKRYGHGPIAAFMDSTGDFQFCTEYKTLKLVTCFNRATRKVTDGGGLIAEVAYYQRYHLKYDLKKANKKGDTLYMLQGRDETGTRSFRNSMMTKRYISPTETKVLMFRGSDNWMQLAYMIEHHMSTKSAINKFAVKTAADASGNTLGFKYGFTDPITKASALKGDKNDASTTFTGYHSLK
jgi:hypothetical protein